MFRQLDRRERVVVVAGTIVTVLALSLVYVVAPQARRWADRESMISLKTEQLLRLRGIARQDAVFRDALTVLRRTRAAVDERLLEGRTEAVAASDLQLLLNRYVTEAGMELQRVDAVGRASDGAAIRRIPAQITVRGGIRELVTLLTRIQSGEKLLTVDELAVSASPRTPDGAEMLATTVKLHGYARGQEQDR